MTSASGGIAAGRLDGPRTYGNWRRPSSPGLPRLGLLGTAAALGSLVLVMLVQISAGLAAAAVTAFVATSAVAPLAWRNRAGRNGWQVAAAQLAWRMGRRRRQHLYVSSLTGPVAFCRTRLPGLLASSTLLEALTAHGEPFALLHLPSAQHYAVVIRCSPEGSQLVDVETVDDWVASWGTWLAKLGHESSLEACTVTVETCRDTGSRLAAEVDAMLVPDAPALSRAALEEIVSAYPHGTSALTAYVTLTFSARRAGHDRAERQQAGDPRTARGRTARVRSTAEMAAQIGRRLPMLLHFLRSAGAGTGRPMTVGEVAEVVRVAYDPAAGPLLDRVRAEQTHRTPGHQDGAQPLVAWEDAGPVAQVEYWDHLRHDSGASITWQMVEPPQGTVQSGVLEQLLDAHEHVARKRVTLMYRPHDPVSAAQVADADVRTAIGRATARAGAARAHESLALTAARQSAAEQAAGAGLVRFSMLVTATVDNPDRLAQAAEVIDQLGPACQVRLRRCYLTQAAAFSAALGVGVVLPNHVAVPEAIRDNL